MHAGTPVVASTAVPSTAGAALEVDALDVDAIADALVIAALDDDRRDELVAAGTVARRAAHVERCAADQHLDLWRALAP